MISGWKKRYFTILKEMNYSEKKDKESALILDSILKKTDSIEKVKEIIQGKHSFCYRFWSIVINCYSKIKKIKKIYKNCS